MIDLSDPMLGERLRRRNAEGRYEISESQLVVNIRTLQMAGDQAGVQRLSEALLERCKPMFLRYSQGLRHRPDLREDAMANMAIHLLNEILNPQEAFLLQNFVHYLRCLCVDEFNRVLRQEGLLYRRDRDGNPSGRPLHIPRTLIDPLRPAPADDEGVLASDVADTHDQYEELHAEEESMRMLTYLHDPLDRKIVVLRVIEDMKWDDIAQVCGYTERTVRARYERARSHLRESILQERTQTVHGIGGQERAMEQKGQKKYRGQRGTKQ
jgi:RNA polymerase sigma factor (sigma-70 family)